MDQKGINQIFSQLSSQQSFSKKYMYDMFEQAVECYWKGWYYASAYTSIVLYEKNFYELLLTKWFKKEDKTEINSGTSFVKLFMEIEKRITDGDNKHKKLRFKDITEELRKDHVITQQEKDIFDEFYSDYRIPTLHGLNRRLTENIGEKDSIAFGEVEMSTPYDHKTVTEMALNKIYYLCKTDGVWDRLNSTK